MIFDQFGIFIK